MRWIDTNWILGLGSSAARLGQTGLAFAVTAQNTLELAAGGEPLTLSISAPAGYSGSTAFAPSDLATGPTFVLAPELTSAPSAGQTVEARPAVWVYDGTGSIPDRTWQWRADGTDIPGATGSAYTPTAGQVGAALSVVETATDGFGARSVASADTTVSA
ncbi:MAG: hypothetical protein AAGG09_15375 [Pseudomonadota bacterium]